MLLKKLEANIYFTKIFKMTADILIKNAFIVTIDNDDCIIENGSIIISNGLIIALGDSSIQQGYTFSKIIDASGNIVMPGLINAHTHIPMTMFRGMADDMPLQKWLNDYIFPAEAKFLTAQNVKIGAELAIYEMIRFGTTCFADMYYFEDEIALLCEQIGIRCLLSEGVLDFPVPNNPTPQHALDFTERQILKYKHSRLINFAVGPHSPYTCSEQWLIQGRALANKYDVPYHIHLSETSFEYEKCIEANGVTPLQNLDRIGCLDGKTIAAHCVFFSEEDVALMVRKNVSAVNNPQSNLKLVSGVAPVPFMLKAGGNVALGTDGAVSNNSLNMFTEMKVAALIHKLNHHDPTAGNAQDIVKMATINGAKALSLDTITGSLEVGKCADIIIIDINQAHAQPLYNVYSQIVYSLCGHDVDTVIVDGKILFEKKQLLCGNLQAAIDRMKVLSSEIRKSF
jgi:5-methylthioadenosine/S-adenosylhomocysteine deaminase